MPAPEPRPFPATPPGRVAAGAVKVPEITALFWVTKAATTAMGESTSDFLVHQMAPVLAVLLGFVTFLVALLWQFSVRRYRTGVYWFAVVMVAVFGTMAADVLHVGLGVPYAVSTAVFAVALAVVFRLWRSTEGTLSVHSVNTTRRELFYWAAVGGTFALGTAAGDLFATTLHLGYLAAGLVFAGLITVPALAYRLGALGPVATFWCCYVLTRPVGASFADYFGRARPAGGLGFGQGTVSLILTLVIAVLVAVLARREHVGRAEPATVPVAAPGEA